MVQRSGFHLVQARHPCPFTGENSTTYHLERDESSVSADLPSSQVHLPSRIRVLTRRRDLSSLSTNRSPSWSAKSPADSGHKLLPWLTNPATTFTCAYSRSKNLVLACARRGGADLHFCLLQRDNYKPLSCVINP